MSLLGGINQSKNASQSSNQTNSNNVDDSYGSHNVDQSGANLSDTHYDSHGVVNAGQGATVNVTDGGIVAAALSMLKGLAGGAASGGESHYDPAAVPASKGIPTWLWIGGGVAVVGVVVVVVIAARRK